MPKACAIALVLVLAALPLAATMAGAEDVQLLQNPGFEEGIEPWIGDHAEPQIVPSPDGSGGSAVLLAGGPQYEKNRVFQRVAAAIEPGQYYHLSVWLWLEDPNVSSVILYVNWYDAWGNQVSDYSSPPLGGQQYGYRILDAGAVTSPPRAARAVVGVLVTLNVQATGFQLYLDDFTFEGPPPSPIASPTAPPTPGVTPSPTPAIAPPWTSTPAPTPPPAATPGAAGEPAEPASFSVLTNGGFEELRADGSPYGWRKVGGEIRSAASPRAEGSFALAITSRTSSTKWAYQVVRVRPGEHYQADAFGSAPEGGEIFLRVSWYASDGGGGQALESDDSTGVIDGPSGFGALSTAPLAAPGEAYSASVRLMFRPGSSAEATAYFDDVRFGPAGEGGHRDPAELGWSSASGGRGAYSEGTAAPRALGASNPGNTAAARLANVAPAVTAALPAGKAPGSGRGWAILLALATPVLAVGGGAGFEFVRRRRRCAADRHQE